MIENGYKLNECDKFVYSKSWNNLHVIISLFVDDMLIFGLNMNAINETKNMIKSHFDMKDSNFHLFLVNKDDGILNQKDYVSIIDSLRYATDYTRPDIAYAVGVLSKFTSKPSRDHWLAIE